MARQRDLGAMASLGDSPYRSSEVATRYGAEDTRGVSVFRESLIQKGLTRGAARSRCSSARYSAVFEPERN